MISNVSVNKNVGVSKQIYEACVGCKSINEKVEAIVAILNELLDKFFEGADVQTMEVKCTAEEMWHGLLQVNLAIKRGISPTKVGVSPANRDGQGLLAIDVHDLLLRICLDGWSWSTCEEQFEAHEIDPNDSSDVESNIKLYQESDGLLPKITYEDVEVLTFSGSHTTSAVRCYVVGGVRSVHSELGVDGFISKNKLLEQFPSMIKPMEQIPMKVIRYQLVRKVPRLVPFLSRAANAGQESRRKQTVLQMMSRLHAVYVNLTQRAGEPPKSEDVIRLAGRGMDMEFNAFAKDVLPWVAEHAGGMSGWALKSIAAYEKALPMKRTIRSKDLLAMAKVTLDHGAVYIPAMLMGMLASPSEYTDGSGASTLFGSADFSTIDGVNKAHALKASKIMISADELANSIPVLEPIHRTRAVGNLKVNLVMHVHGKHTKTRKLYKSMADVTMEFYNNLRKQVIGLNGEMPSWKYATGEDSNVVADVMVPTAIKTDAGLGMKELNEKGELTDDELKRLGFKVGGELMRKGVKVTEHMEIWTLVSIDEPKNSVMITATLDAVITTLPRRQLIKLFALRPAACKEDI